MISIALNGAVEGVCPEPPDIALAFGRFDATLVARIDRQRQVLDAAAIAKGRPSTPYRSSRGRRVIQSGSGPDQI
jgi:hypothetical protein